MAPTRFSPGGSDGMALASDALQYGPGVQGAQGGQIKWRKVQIRPL